MAIKTRQKLDPKTERYFQETTAAMSKEYVAARVEQIAADPHELARIAKVWGDQMKRVAGRPSSGKRVVSLRLDPDVIEKFRATGPGWQARINEALRDHDLNVI